MSLKLMHSLLTEFLENICIRMLKSPWECRPNDLWVAIAGLEIVLSVRTKADNIEEQTQTLNNLGNAYLTLAEIGVEGETNLRSAIAVYKEAVEITRRLNLTKDLSASLNNLGNAYSTLAEIGVEGETNLRSAIAACKEAVEVTRRLNLTKDLSTSLNNLGVAYSTLAEIGVDGETNLRSAIAAHKEAVEIRRRLDLTKNLSDSLNNLGNAYLTLAEIGVDGKTNLRNAIAAYKEAVEIRRRLDLTKDLSNSLNNLGVAYLTLAEIGVDGKTNLRNAIAAYKEAVEITRRLDLTKDLSNSLNNLGIAYLTLAKIGAERESNLLSTIAVHNQAVEIRRRLDLTKDLSGSLNNLGNVYSTLAEIGVNGETNFRNAITAYKEAVEITRRLDLTKDLSTSLNNLGVAYSTLAKIGVNGETNLRSAIAVYKEAVEITRRLNLTKDLSASLNNLGVAYSTLAEIGVEGETNLRSAIAVHNQAVKITRRLGLTKDLSGYLNNLGNVYKTLAEIGVDGETNLRSAIAAYRESLQLSTTIVAPVDTHRIGRSLGDLAFKQGMWEIALEGYEEAIASIEQIRTWAKDDKQRQEILTQAIEIYSNALQCYINLGQYQQAILLTERARSRHLVELMYSNDLYKDGEIKPEIKPYLEEYEQIQAQINQEQLKLKSDENKKAISISSKSQKSFEELKDYLEDLYERKDKLWLEIRKQDKVLANGLEVPHLEFDNLKKLIAKSPKTALLSFYSTNQHTYIFILRHNHNSDEISLQLHTCENEGYQDLQTLVRNKWLIPYKEDNKTWRQAEQIEKILQEISDKLKINDLIQNHLQNIEELILIPHIYLHLIPFAALPVNSSNSCTTEAPKYLSDLFRLRIAPSAQILTYCQEREEQNPYPSLEGQKYVTIENASDDLIAASYECEQIAQMLDIPPAQRLIGKQNATVNNYRQIARNPQLRGLHSSHHAGSELDKPLESALELGDGYLTLGQLLSPGWRMPHIVEIFLSCCETNLGNPNITDDILTLATGFLCAGARSVISTLWSVDALATAFFCLFYYQHRQAGHNRATALQIAQKDLRNKTTAELEEQLSNINTYLYNLTKQTTEGSKKRKIARLRLDIINIKSQPNNEKLFASPFYWAGFICQGL